MTDLMNMDLILSSLEDSLTLMAKIMGAMTVEEKVELRRSVTLAEYDEGVNLDLSLIDKSCEVALVAGVMRGIIERRNLQEPEGFMGCGCSNCQCS